ncbi:helix-turn-helix transcriptional regulator [Brevibacterium spongiae]|uniref:LuxR C-terminal-related transcriptional regulator n=1 Tax=Brevibacterium spongiae TaxID=2909672 RepID=A0ABY5SQP2_9MICO|nr:LuxR family transcriptional regulator [Brevibacterium spongiae]UVI36848.1 LuxR C-terminal-related transcriptional regulator [Brevibacterium spongiae]
MTLMIRDNELAALTRVVHGSGPATIVMAGEFGSGRSSLINAAAEASPVPSRIFRVSSTESTWNYSGLSAFLSIIDDLNDTSFNSLMRFDGGPESAFHLAEDLDTALRETLLPPMSLFIDDADLLDPLSQDVIGYLLRRRSMRNLRTVLATGSLPADGPWSSFPQLPLDPLGVPSLIRLGRSLTSPLAWDAVLETVARVSAGSPMSLKSMLSVVRSEVLHGTAPMSLPLPLGQKLCSLLAAALDEFSPGQMACLRVVSCAGSVPSDIAAAVAGPDAGELDELVHLGTLNRVNDELLFADARLRSAVYHAMPEAEQLRLHGEIAGLCTGRHAHHRPWHESFTSGADGLVEDLVCAARTHVHTGRIQTAIELTERALTLAGDELPTAAFEALTEALIMKCEYALARRLLSVLRGPVGDESLGPTHTRLQALLDFSQFGTVTDQHVDEILALHGRSAPDECALLLATLTSCQLQRWEVRKATRTAERMRAFVGADSLQARVVDSVVALFTEALAGRELPGPAQLHAIGEDIRACFPAEYSWLLISHALALADRHEDARPLLKNLSDQFSHIPSLFTRYARRVTLLNEMRACNFFEVRRLEKLITAGEERGGAAQDLITSAMIAILDNRHDEAKATVRAARRRITPGASRVTTHQLAIVQAKLAMHDRDFAAANRHFAQVRHSSAADGSPHLLRFHDDYIESLVYSGHTDRALEVFGDLTAAYDKAPTAWTEHAIARTRPLLLTGEESLQAFAELVETWQQPGFEYLRARTLFSYANRLTELGRDGEARDTRELAGAIFAELGLDELCAADDQPAPTLLDRLDDKELPVVQLLLKGHKNHVIAHELFVSVRTVELRLTNIYRKAGVKSRFELMRLIEAEATDEDERVG